MSKLISRYKNTDNLFAYPSKENRKSGVKALPRKVINSYGIELDYTHVFEKLEAYEQICEDPDALDTMLDLACMVLSKPDDCGE